MEFTVSRNDLAVAVTHAVHGVPSNPYLPVRAGMHIKTENGLEFHGSDGEVTFSGYIPGNIHGKDSITIPGKVVADVIRTLPDKDVHFITDGLMATLTCGRAQFKFPVYPDEYPELPVNAEIGGGVDGDVFCDAVKKIVPAAAKGDSNPTLSAVYLEPVDHTLWAVCTDKYRLAAVQVPWSPVGMLKPALVPSWAAERFTRAVAGDVTLGWDDRVITMASENVEVTSRMLSGEWPHGWRTLLPREPCTVEVAAEDLLGALKRALLAAQDGPADPPVELTFTPGRLRVEAGYGDGSHRGAKLGNHADDVLDASYDGDERRFRFGISMLADGLAGCGPVVKFGWAGAFAYLESGAYTYTMVPRRRI